VEIKRIFRDGEVFVEVDGAEHKLARLLRVPSIPASISAAMAKHASTFAYWAMLQAETDADERSDREDVKLAEQDLKDAEARAYVRIKNDPTYTVGGKTPTEEGVKALIAVDSEVHIAKERLQEARAQVEEGISVSQTIKAVVEALRIRGQMLQSVNANMRTEYSFTAGGAPSES
jgi:hypothetical protein